MAPPNRKRKKLAVGGIFAAAKKQAQAVQEQAQQAEDVSKNAKPGGKPSRQGRHRAAINRPAPHVSGTSIQRQSGDALAHGGLHGQQQNAQQQQQLDANGNSHALSQIHGVVATTASLASISDDKLAKFVVGSQVKSKLQREKEARRLKEQKATEEAAAAYEVFAASFGAPRDPADLLAPARNNNNMHDSQNPQQHEMLMPHNDSHGGGRNGPGKGSWSNGQDMTTNIYVGNLAPTVNEERLQRAFEVYGPLVSVKVMWPRTQEEIQRQRNCGFVAFQMRNDAECALEALVGMNLDGYPIALSWGKEVKNIATMQPLLKLLDPLSNGSNVALTALPTMPTLVRAIHHDKMPIDARQRVVIWPEHPDVAVRITHFARFVSRFGSALEHQVLVKERGNPEFEFLNPIRSPDLFWFYTWRVCCFANDDMDDKDWRKEPFQIINNSSSNGDDEEDMSAPKADSDAQEEWLVPPAYEGARDIPMIDSEDSDEEDMLLHTTGAARERMRDQRRRKRRVGDGTVSLTNLDKDLLDTFIDNLTPARLSIRATMGFMYAHADAAVECADRLVTSILYRSRVTTPTQFVARLYCVSDVLYNSSAPLRHAAVFRDTIVPRLADVMLSFNELLSRIQGRITADAISRRVESVLSAWGEWMVFPAAFLFGLRKCGFQLSRVDAIDIQIRAVELENESLREHERQMDRLDDEDEQDKLARLFDDEGRAEEAELKRQCTLAGVSLVCGRQGKGGRFMMKARLEHLEKLVAAESGETQTTTGISAADSGGLMQPHHQQAIPPVAQPTASATETHTSPIAAGSISGVGSIQAGSIPGVGEPMMKGKIDEDLDGEAWDDVDGEAMDDDEELDGEPMDD